jgi:GDP-mannose 4,6-dehydratase
MTRSALVTGITGQDGSYLAELLLQKDYHVHGIIRRSSTFNTERVDHLYRDVHDPQARLFLHYGDLADGTGLRRVLEQVKPDEVYNLGAVEHEQTETLSDFLLRRTGIGTSACMGMDCCEQIARWMGEARGWDRTRADQEIREYLDEIALGQGFRTG